MSLFYKLSILMGLVVVLSKGSEKYDPKKRFTALPESLMFPLPPLNASEARSRRGEIFVPRKRGDK